MEAEKNTWKYEEGAGGGVGKVKRWKDFIWHALFISRGETQVMCEAQATTIAGSDRC